MAVPKIEQRTFAQLQMVDVLAVGEVKRCMEVVQCEREPERTSKRTVEQTDVYTLSSAEDGTWAFAVAKFSGSCCSRANLSVAFQFVRTCVPLAERAAVIRFIRAYFVPCSVLERSEEA